MSFYEKNPASIYPHSIDQFITKKDAKVLPPGVKDTGEWVMAGHVNHIQNAIIQIESILGLRPQGAYGSVSDRLDQIMGGFSSLTRLSYFSGNPRMACSVNNEPWPNTSAVIPFFKTIDYLFYKGSFADHGLTMIQLRGSAGVEMSVLLERNEYTNDIDSSELLRWKNANQSKFFVLIDDLLASDIEVVNTFLDNVRMYGAELDIVFYSSAPDTFIEAIESDLLRVEPGEGVFVFKYLTTRSRINRISEALIHLQRNHGARIGGLAFIAEDAPLFEEFFFGLGLQYVYALNYFGLAYADGGIIEEQTLCLYPYMPLNINYMSATNSFTKEGNLLSKIIENYDMAVDLNNSTLSTSLFKIPSSFIYFDKLTKFDASIIDSGILSEYVGVTLQSIIAGPNKVFYTNNSGEVLELPLGAINTFLMSNGPLTAPSWKKAITGPSTSTPGNLPMFSDASGHILADSGIDSSWFDQDVSSEATPTFESVNVTDNFYVNDQPLAVFYIHYQNTSSNFWIVTHNKGTTPSVTIIDDNDEMIYADIEYVSANQLEISFTSPQKGKAYIV